MSTLFFGAFLGMGGLFFFLMLSTMTGDLNRRMSWVATPCRIESSRMTDLNLPNQPYRFDAVYRYRWEDREYAGTRWKKEVEHFSDAGEVQELIRRFAEGTDAICYVNPLDPAEAVLEHGSLLMGLWALFPLIFVAIGAGGIWFTWFPLNKQDARAQGPRPLSEQARPPKVSGTCLGTAFTGVFLLIGCLLTWFFTVQPLLKMADARGWVQTDCRILTSRLQESRDSDGTTYRIDILYEYTHEGRSYRSSRYDFLSQSGSSSGSTGKMEVIRRYPAGSKAVCWVNPANPAESVLHRGWSESWWISLFGPIFALFGGGAMWAVRRGARQEVRHRGAAGPDLRNESAPSRDPGLPRDPGLSGEGGGQVVRQRELPWELWLPERPRNFDNLVWNPVRSRFSRLIGMAIFAAIWNGAVAVMGFFVVGGWQRDDPDYLFMIFTIPFALIGLFLIGGVFQYFMALFNPRPILRLNTIVLEPGGLLEVKWEMQGAARRIRRLQFRLRGTEEATYRRGTSSYTDKKVFADIPLFEADLSIHPASGTLSVRIPDEAMHSLDIGSNRIGWELVVHGDIRLWPDVRESLPIYVVPGEKKP